MLFDAIIMKPGDALETLITIFVQLTMTVTLAHTSGATCLEEQVNSCRQAAFDGKLEGFSGGGQCKVNSYVHYTHECRVSNYLPSVDFCCCAMEQKVMCCRYHQDWDRFRCSEADDTIDTITSSSDGNHGNHSSHPQLPLPLEILIPVIIGPLVALVCCVFCCTKCLCHKYYEEDEKDCNCSCCSSCCKACRNRDDDDDDLGPMKSGGPSADEQMPLTYPNLLQQQPGQQRGPLHSSSSHEGKSLYHPITTSVSSGDQRIYTQVNTAAIPAGNYHPVSTTSDTEPRALPSAPPLLDNDVFVQYHPVPHDPTYAIVYRENNNPPTSAPAPVSCAGVTETSTAMLPYVAAPFHYAVPVTTTQAPTCAICPSCSSAFRPPLASPPSYEESQVERTAPLASQPSSPLATSPTKDADTSPMAIVSPDVSSPVTTQTILSVQEVISPEASQ